MFFDDEVSMESVPTLTGVNSISKSMFLYNHNEYIRALVYDLECEANKDGWHLFSFKYTISVSEAEMHPIMDKVLSLLNKVVDGRIQMIQLTPDVFYIRGDQFIVEGTFYDPEFKVIISGKRKFVDEFSTILTAAFDEMNVPTLKWYFSTARGMDYAHLRLDNKNVIKDSYYPFIKCGVENFYESYLNSTAPILMLLGEPGTGKCFAPGTPILMFDGSIRSVEDIQNGEVVMGNDGTKRIVSGVTTGTEKMYRITPTKGESFVVNEPHILSMKFNDHGVEKTVNMTVKDFLQQSEFFQNRCKLYRADEIPFMSKPVALDPYFLGIWLGDGSKDSQSITNPDSEVVDFLRLYANEFGYSLSDHSSDDRCSTWSIVNSKGKNNKILDTLREYNLIGNKHIPSVFMTNDKTVRNNLLSGIIDSDGHLSDGGYEIVSNISSLANQIAYVARSLGLAAYVSEKFAKSQTMETHETYYRVFISGNVDMLNVRIARKKAEPRQQIKNVLRTGFTVEYIGEGIYHGFEVDKNHLFLLGDFTVVHNTSFIRNMISKYKRRTVVTYDEGIMNSDSFYIQYLTEDDCNLMVIEDADVLLESRETEGNKTMAKLLNVSDGLCKVVNKKIIFTTNIKSVSKIDPALLRPGRCFDTVMFRKLNQDEAEVAAKDAGKELEVNKSGQYTIAEVFNPKATIAEAPKRQRVGFV